MPATTWDPLKKGAGAVLSNGNLTVTGNINGPAKSVDGVSAGKRYWEISVNSPLAIVGIATAAATLTSYPGSDANGRGLYFSNGNKYSGGAASAYTAVPFVLTVGVKLDLDAGTLGFIVNGVDQGIAFSGLPAGPWYAMAGGAGSGTTIAATANFGASPFHYMVPAGYTAGLGVPTTRSGTVTDAGGAPAARTVRAYHRASGRLLGETISDAITGAYSLDVFAAAEAQIIALDDDTGTLENDKILRVLLD